MTTSPASHPRAVGHRGQPLPATAGARATAACPDPGVVRGFRTPVRGHAFAANPPGGAPVLGAHGTAVRLVREGDNPADGFAVAVWVSTPTPWRIGYLDRVVAARIAPLLDAGHRIEAELAGAVASPGGWDRPLVTLGGGRGTHHATSAPGEPGPLWGRPPGVQRRTVPPR